MIEKESKANSRQKPHQKR